MGMFDYDREEVIRKHFERLRKNPPKRRRSEQLGFYIPASDLARVTRETVGRAHPLIPGLVAKRWQVRLGRSIGELLVIVIYEGKGP